MNNVRKFYFANIEIENLKNFTDPKRDDRQQKQTQKNRSF